MQATANFVHNSRDKFIKMKVEEQMVPSGGLSPQPEIHGSNYIPKYSGGTNYGSGLGSLDDCAPYGNIADTFDLSLLGDSYEDHDMATVPSPMALLESTWQPMSFYPSSPTSEFRAFSPDCVKQYSGDQNLPCSNGQGMTNGNSLICNSMGDNNGNSAHGNSLSPSNDVGRNILLRQCLEDTTFQIKYNFKPVDIPAINVPDDVNDIMKSEGYSGTDIQTGNESMEINQIDPVFSLVYEQMRSDVQNTCSILSISQDPTQWSVTDVQSWLVQSLSSVLGVSYDGNNNHRCDSLRNFYNIDGRNLCSLNEEEFRRRDPVNGDRLFANLELWKMLQWKVDDSTTGPNSQNSVSSQLDLDFTALVTGVGSPTDSIIDLQNGSPEASASPSMVQDMKLFSEQCSPDNFSSPKFSNPSSVGTSSKNSDDESEEEEEKPVEKVKPTRTTGSKTGAHIHLWQFLKELLETGQQHGACIRWLDQSRGVFKIEDSVRVARLWGLRKNRPAMNYDKLSRSIRQYYRKGIMRKTERSQRLVYQFCHPYGF